MKRIFTVIFTHVLLSILIVQCSSKLSNLPEMIFVEGGTFQMGDEWGVGFEDELPVHQVTVSSFAISKTEVTVTQYRAYCLAKGIEMPEAPEWGWIDDHPIVNVDWYDAVAYTEWLSKKTGENYRLPTEAEWEYAARGGKHHDDFRYSGGDILETVGWYEGNSDNMTHPVAQKLPNSLGIYDMTGNVWEWCHDLFVAYSSKPRVNPRGPASGSYPILRGGGYLTFSSEIHISYRGTGSPYDRGSFLGFRVVKSEER